MDTGTVVTVVLVLLAVLAVVYIVKRLTRREESEPTHLYDKRDEGLFAPTTSASSSSTEWVDDAKTPVLEKNNSKKVSYYGGSPKGYETSEARKRREERDNTPATSAVSDFDGDGLPGTGTGVAVGLGTGVLVASTLNDEPVRVATPVVSPDPSPETSRSEAPITFSPSYPSAPAPVSTPEPSGSSYSGGGSSGSSYDSGSSGSSYSGSDSGGSSFSNSD